VFVLELDRQGTLSNWIESRQVETGPDFERVDAAVLDKAIQTLAGAGYDLAVIDTPGIDSPATNAAMRIADLCLVPCRRRCAIELLSSFPLKSPFLAACHPAPPTTPRLSPPERGRCRSL
jgi:chromosome partitioning protein